MQSYVVDIDAHFAGVPLGYGGLYNHSSTPNAHFRLDPNGLVIYAIADIATSAEICIDYGKAYWKFWNEVATLRDQVLRTSKRSARRLGPSR